MCEFFFIQAKDGTIPEDALRAMLNTAQDAAARNGDGTGVFNAEGIVFRTEQRLDGDLSRRIAALYAGSETVVVHLRLATQGSTDLTNVHPFVADDLTLSHNGTVHGVEEYGDTGDADSKMLLHKIVDQDGHTVERVKDALDTTTGWLSVFLLDRADGSLYYFRQGADLYVGENERYRVAATKRRRLGIRNVTQPDAGIVHRVDTEGFTAVDTFQTASIFQRRTRPSSMFAGYGAAKYGRSTYRDQETLDQLGEEPEYALPDWWGEQSPQYIEAEG